MEVLVMWKYVLLSLFLIYLFFYHSILGILAVLGVGIHSVCTELQTKDLRLSFLGNELTTRAVLLGLLFYVSYLLHSIAKKIRKVKY